MESNSNKNYDDVIHRKGCYKNRMMIMISERHISANLRHC